MIRKILGFFALISLMAFALVAYSMTSSVSESHSAVMKYVQKIKSETLAFASPVLKRLGVDVEKIQTSDANIVERQMENATNKVNEATQMLSQ